MPCTIKCFINVAIRKTFVFSKAPEVFLFMDKVEMHQLDCEISSGCLYGSVDRHTLISNMGVERVYF